jgi:hypothetical protein
MPVQSGPRRQFRPARARYTLSRVNRPGPVYRILLKHAHYANPTCVVAGRDPRESWLYVHAATPVALKLTPMVVRFLRDALADLPAASEPVGMLDTRLAERD